MQVILGAEARDRRAVAFSQIDVIPTVEKLIAADGIDGKRAGPGPADDRLLLEIDRDGLFGVAMNRRAQLGNVAFRSNRSKQPILDGVLGKISPNDGAMTQRK